VIMLDETHYSRFAVAYARGRTGNFTDPDEVVIDRARSDGLRLHRFKRHTVLPRVKAVLGTLMAFRPESLVDIGSGRGAFLWPFLDTMPWVQTTSVEMNPERASQLSAFARGLGAGYDVVRADVRSMPLKNASVDCVTVLEVLEHMLDSERAAAECLRIARRVVIASVPSHADENPEHVRLFNRDTLTTMFLEAGARKVKIDAVPGHLICVATK
jgi:ubiquinone/menaquinone biosynthesis C-methylase UbiE